MKKPQLVVGVLLTLSAAVPAVAQDDDASPATASADPQIAELQAALAGTWTANLDHVVTSGLDTASGAGWISTGLQSLGAHSWGRVVLDDHGGASAYAVVLGQVYDLVGEVSVVGGSDDRVTLRVVSEGWPTLIVVADRLGPDHLRLHVEGHAIDAYRASEEG